MRVDRVIEKIWKHRKKLRIFEKNGSWEGRWCMKNILVASLQSSLMFFTRSKIYISKVGHLQLSSHTIPYVDRRSGKILGSSILLEYLSYSNTNETFMIVLQYFSAQNWMWMISNMPLFIVLSIINCGILCFVQGEWCAFNT